MAPVTKVQVTANLFKKVENAIAVYTSELDHSTGGVDPEVLLKDRLKKGKERLDDALEALPLLCEPVKPPKDELEHIHYFCGDTEIPADLQEREPQRATLYKATASLVRAYANIADELEQAGIQQRRHRPDKAAAQPLPECPRDYG